MMRYSAICLFFLTLLGLLGCNEIPQEHREFFRSGPGNIEKAIFDYPLDQQIDLMIIGWTKTHPPFNLYFQVAQNGEPIVPLLIRRLSNSNEMETLRVIVMCFYEIENRHFRWTTHQKYLVPFEKALSQINDPKMQKELELIMETGIPYPYAKGLKRMEKVDK